MPEQTRWEGMTPEQRIANNGRTREWRKRNPLTRAQKDAHNARQKKSRAAAKARDPKALRQVAWARRIPKTYGISVDRYNALFTAQRGVCAACQEPERVMQAGSVIMLSVDHDHGCCPSRRSCGRCIRGLVCSRCNNTMGRAGDNADLLRQMAHYLERAKNGSPDGFRTHHSPFREA